MKIILSIIALLLPLTSAQASDNIPDVKIFVNCQCSYYVDGLEQTLLVSGESHATQKDLDSCILIDNKVINPEGKTACFKAKMNASWNCMQSVKSRTNPGMIGLPSVLLDQDTCYGEIQMGRATMKNNPGN